MFPWHFRNARRQGYKPISYQEFREYDPIGAETFRKKTGPLFTIQVNDLIACKIPIKAWQKIQEAQAKMILQTQNDLSRVNPNLRGATHGINQVHGRGELGPHGPQQIVKPLIRSGQEEVRE